MTKSPNVFGFENYTGDALYKALDDIRRGGVLNIARKTQATSSTPFPEAYTTCLRSSLGSYRQAAILNSPSSKT